MQRANMAETVLSAARRRFYNFLTEHGCLVTDTGIPSVADGSSEPSRLIAGQLFDRLGIISTGKRLPGQRVGALFEEACAQFLSDTFLRLNSVRPGRWEISRKREITEFEQYEHLSTLANLAADNIDLASAMVSDYLVKPDVVIARRPISEVDIDSFADARLGLRTPLRAINHARPLLHASISCKWTIRSDRSQNTRSEALSLVRNRKGPLPHIVAITAEPLPQRIASIALGTGDMDCVYHIGLQELDEAVTAIGNEASKKSLATLVSGKLLRDITDLPLDLAI